MNRYVYYIIFLIFNFYSLSVYGVPHTTRIQELSIKSLKQKAIDQDTLYFEGEVEIFIDEKLHVWADFVTVNKKKQTLDAQAKDGCSLTIENNDFIILAEKLFLNLLNKTGSAHNVRFHVDEGFLSAECAEKYGENEWRMINVLYTPCDAPSPHWYLRAQRAEVRGGYFIKSCNIVLKIGCIPVLYLPRMIFPIQGQSKSGFLIPRFYFDYVYGFGFKQEYYKYFGPHCDTTFSLDWRDKRGFVFSDEFRWALAPENFLNLKAHYAIARDSYVQKRDKIFKATDHRYWILGTDFRSSSEIMRDFMLASLVRLDFGTDKKIGYHFFNSTDDVDDEFYNSGHLRLFGKRHAIEFSCARETTSRKQFYSLSHDQLAVFETQKNFPSEDIHSAIKEVQDCVDLTYLPRVEWNTAYSVWDNFLLYRHDFFMDQVTSHQQEFERFFVNGSLIKENKVIPFTKSDLLRLNYRADIRESYPVGKSTVSFWVNPHIQFRSNVRDEARSSKNVLERRIFGHGAFRFFLTTGAEWALPETMMSNEEGTYSYFLQPLVRWNLTPKFDQKYWHYFDHWDRAYPQNQISCILRNTVFFDNFSCDWQLTQGYDFYNRSDIFFLQRGTLDNHVLPLRFEATLNCNAMTITAHQEYEWYGKRLLQSEVQLGFHRNTFTAHCGYLFQRQELQKERKLVADIPHFLTCNIMLPITKQLGIWYDGQFYAENKAQIFSFSTIRPLLHRIRLEYNGHCWGFYLGFEEKKYRESGNWKQERAMVLSIRLDSLGSFAQKFRQPNLNRLGADRLN